MMIQVTMAALSDSKKTKKSINMTFHELLPIYNAIDDESAEWLRNLKKPRFLRPRRLLLHRAIVYFISKINAVKRKISRRVKTPDNLNDITIGQVFLLSTSDDVFLPFRELLKLTNEQTALLDVDDAVGFINFVRNELKRINDILASAKAEPTAEERAAGIENVGKSVGAFGAIDYIAKRNGITHDEASDLPWKRVYAMMILDRDNELFRRRLMDVYQRKRK